MDWTFLGHAMWLTEAAGTRILFDPLLRPTHHGGVFEVFPRRTVDVDGLRPDVIVVSHRHPDHFDVGSLHALARRDPSPVVLTADPLVFRSCQRLGLSHVSLLDAGQVVPLEGATLLTTPSHCDVVEWGMMVSTADGVAWNQVDTDVYSPSEVANLFEVAGELLGCVDLSDGPDLVLARWNPILQIHAQTGRATRFPVDAYRTELERAAALGRATVVPGAAGGRYVAPFTWMNAFGFPVSRDRFERDLVRLNPSATVLPPVTGGTYRVRRGEVDLDPTPRLVTLHDAPDDRVFAPHHLPRLTDPNRFEGDVSEQRAIVADWVRGDLVQAVRRVWPALEVPELELLLEVVWPDGTEPWTVCCRGDEVGLERRDAPEWDARVAIAGSELAEVIAGRSHWGSPLLGGLLRAGIRAYQVDPAGLRPLRLPEVWIYLALSYEAADTRCVDWQLTELGC